MFLIKKYIANPVIVQLALIWFMAGCFTACNTADRVVTPLKDEIKAMLDSVEGDFAVAFLDMATGDSLFINEEESFHAASTMKTPVMMEAFEYLHRNDRTLVDSLELYNSFFSIVDSSVYSLSPDRDSDSTLYTKVGEKITWYDLIFRMITQSSNLSTNVLMDQLSGAVVTEHMRELGAPHIEVLRGVEDMKAYEAGFNNTTTALDQMRIYEKLARYEVVDSASSYKMIEILMHQEHNGLIPARLPEEVEVAHKTGSITGVHHDAGIVFLPDGRRYVLVLLSKNVEDMNKADAVMQRVSRLVYDYMFPEM